MLAAVVLADRVGPADLEHDPPLDLLAATRDRGDEARRRDELVRARPVHARRPALRARGRAARDLLPGDRQGVALPSILPRLERPDVHALALPADRPRPARCIGLGSARSARASPSAASSRSSCAQRQRIVVEVGRRGKLVVGEPYFTPGVPVVLDSKGIGDVAPGDLAVVRTGRGRARVEQVLGPARPDRERARGAARRARRAAAVRAARAAGAEPRRAGRPARACRRTRSIPDTAKDFDDALSFRREPDGIRAWVHIADVSYFVGAGTPLDRWRRRARASRRTCPARSRRCCRTSSPTTSARCVRTSTGCASRSRCRRTGEPHFYRSVIRSDARLTYGQARAARGAAGDPRAARAERRARDELRERRFARGALQVQTPEVASSLRRQGRRRRCVARGRAARAHARRGADDPRQRAGRRVPRRPPPRGALPRARAARPAGGRAPAREARRPRRADAARRRSGCRRSRRRALAGETSKLRHAVRGAGRPRARGVPRARPARAQAGALRPAQPRPLRARERRRTATSPRRSAATPTSSSTARCCASSACRTIRCRGDLAAARRAHLGARARGGRRSSTSPTTSASPGCSSAGSSSSAGTSAFAGEITGMIGSGLFVRFGDVFEGFLPARRLPGEFFELNHARYGARRPHDRAHLPARRPDRGAGRVDRAQRGQGRARARLEVDAYWGAWGTRQWDG